VRFREETVNHHGTSFSVFHDIYGWWFADVNGHRLRWGYDFSTGFDPAREREATIRLGRDYVDRVL